MKRLVASFFLGYVLGVAITALSVWLIDTIDTEPPMPEGTLVAVEYPDEVTNHSDHCFFYEARGVPEDGRNLVITTTRMGDQGMVLRNTEMILACAVTKEELQDLLHGNR